MRERFRSLLPAVWGLTIAAVLVLPVSVAAASGLPASVTVEPPAATGGDTVEVIGLDFPALEVVEVQLATGTGVTHLFDTVTADSGYFRESVVLPADLGSGVWEVRATALDGTTASHRFQASVEALPAAAETAVAGAAARGNSGTDIVFLLVIALLLGAVGTAGTYVWRDHRGAGREPGMGLGDDPIWSGGATAEGLQELTAADEPVWLAAHGES